MEMGPVDVVVLRFPGNGFTGEIARALNELVVGGLVRVIDLMVVHKQIDGAATTVELAGLAATSDPEFSMLVDMVEGHLLDEEDLEVAARDLEPGTSAALLVWENTWAAPFVSALAAADAELVDQARIPRQDVLAALRTTPGP